MTPRFVRISRAGVGTLTRMAPGLATLRDYRREWLRADIVAGVSVAAVALPTAIAYAQVAGFSPTVGMYTAIVSLVVYALLATSRHLIVNPDAATCAMVAAICAPIAGADPGTRLAVSIALAVLVGSFLIFAGVFHLGFIADFLSRPILLGLLNGVALTILVGQIGPLLGFTVHADSVLLRLVETVRGIGHIHAPTAMLSAAFLVTLLVARRLGRRTPGPLLVMIAGAAAVFFWNLESRGVAVVGPVSGGLPRVTIPTLSTRALTELLGGAFGLAIVIFSKSMLHANAFAQRHRYKVDADRELIAVGAANIAAGLSHGFAVSGTDSRTAIADMMGAKTQLTSLIVAALMTLTLVFLAEPLALVPKPAIAAVLLIAAASLIEWSDLERLRRVSRGEFTLSVTTAAAVLLLGVLPGLAFAVTVAIIRLLALSRRPHDAVLGRVEGVPGFHSIEEYPDAATIDGLAIYRFESGLLFYNAPFFKLRALRAASHPDTRWLILDASSIPAIDATGAEMVEELRQELAERGITLTLASPRHKVRNMLGRAGTLTRLGPAGVHPTIKGAVRAYYRATHDRRVELLGVSLRKLAPPPPADDAPPPPSALEHTA